MRFLPLLILFSSQLIFAQIKERPKLVVGIVVDQMRYEYLQRFWNKFGEEGFKRMVNNGYRFDQMYFDYAPTYTGPGHASIYTGTTPAVHGIVGNNWIDAQTGKKWYCVEDSGVEPLGTTNDEHRRSPNNLISSTITDQLKLSTNFEGKVISISLKDRSAILPGGQFADWAFWINHENGEMVSSTFYGDALPEYLVNFNEKNLPEKYLSEPWETLLPIDEYMESQKDDNFYEGTYRGEDSPTFPHDLPAIAKVKGNDLIYETPFGNDYVADLAKDAIAAEQLGGDGVTDFLALGFSSTDVIGHMFGPQSIEVEDTYLRLDRTMAELLKYLDENVGEGKYLLFLTADHGVADVPAFLKQKKGKGGYFKGDSVFRELQGYLNKVFKKPMAMAWYNQQIYFDPATFPEMPEMREKVYAVVKEFYRKQEGVARVYSEYDLEDCQDGLPFCEEISNGYWPQRSGEIVVLLKPEWMESRKSGTTHGSPYSYDTHVPMLFFGWSIKPGSNMEKYVIEDIAPTVAAMLGLSLPSGTTGVTMEFE